jgi:hypothetical protein
VPPKALLRSDGLPYFSRLAPKHQAMALMNIVCVHAVARKTSTAVERMRRDSRLVSGHHSTAVGWGANPNIAMPGWMTMLGFTPQPTETYCTTT